MNEVDDYTGGDHQCVVQRGYTMSAWKRYDAWYNSLYGMCGPYPNREPTRGVATVACESAEAHCGHSTSCMRDYINSIISSGYIEMCRGNYNLMVTTGDHDYAGYLSSGGVVSVYDGSWAHCIFYCTS